MKYISDWEKRKERLTALWSREITDRCCVAVKCVDWNKGGHFPFSDDPVEQQKYWMDGEYLYKRAAEMMEITYHAGDAFPNFFSNMGVSAHAAFFNNPNYGYSQETMWFFPTLGGLKELKVDETNDYFNKVIKAGNYLADHAKGDFCISMPDFSGNADGLAHLRGSENLLMDFIESPDEVHHALGLFQQQYERITREYYNIVKENNEGGSTIGWMNTWAPGLHSQMQCDLSVMISNAAFEEFIMPELIAQTELLDYSTYHFDGIEQIRHLPSILSVDKLDMIQWTHVEGQPKPYKYMDELKRIQEAGKALLLFPSPEDIPVYMENLSSKGLIFVLETKTREEADEIVKYVEKHTRA